jgi:hypothetical protein
MPVSSSGEEHATGHMLRLRADGTKVAPTVAGAVNLIVRGI